MNILDLKRRAQGWMAMGGDSSSPWDVANQSYGPDQQSAFALANAASQAQQDAQFAGLAPEVQARMRAAIAAGYSPMATFDAQGNPLTGEPGRFGATGNLLSTIASAPPIFKAGAALIGAGALGGFGPSGIGDVGSSAIPAGTDMAGGAELGSSGGIANIGGAAGGAGDFGAAAAGTGAGGGGLFNLGSSPLWNSITSPSTWTANGIGTAAGLIGLGQSLTGNKSAPAAPDYASLANQDLTASRPNITTPYGTSTWTNNNGVWTNNQSLSPAQQALLDQSNATKLSLGQTGNTLANGLLGKLNTALPNAYDPTQSTNNAADLINARLLPQQERDRAALETRLANQGITQGSEAWKNAQDDLGRTQNDARSQAQLQGITLGQQQQAQTYQQSLTNRNQPLNELNALQTGSQVSNPTFANYANSNGATQAGQYSYNAALGGVNAANASNANTANGLFSLAGTLYGQK